MKKFIVFSGLDGSGKSTQIELIKNKFSNINQKSYSFWSRVGYSPGFEKIKSFIRFFMSSNYKKKGFTKERKIAFSSNVFRKIWLIIAVLDLIFYYSFFLRLKMILGYNLICDRYLIDSEIDLKIAFPDEKVNKWFLWKVLKLLSLNPDYHFILIISSNESFKRSISKNEPYPDEKDILIKRLKYYKQLSKRNNKYILINCEKSINEIKNEIKSHIF